MAEFLKSLITVSNSEYRKCMVDGERALFHRWHKFCNVVDASPMIGGHHGGQMS